MFILYLLLAFLLGSLPFGLIIGVLFYNVDIREQGSTNIGMTNVWRTLGILPALCTLIGDLGKGYLAICIATLEWTDAASLFWVTLSVVLGHCYSILLSGKGGKGVATGAGVLFALHFKLGALIFIIWLVARYYTKKSSLSAFISLLFLLPLTYWLTPEHSCTAMMLMVIIVWRHKDNITRLRAGTET